MLVRLGVRRDDLADLLEESWRLRAPKRLLGSWEGRQQLAANVRTRAVVDELQANEFLFGFSISIRRE
jgi:hypothetical protein